jgi:CubicO group peptidase (beta-lactamase class C family)
MKKVLLCLAFPLVLLTAVRGQNITPTNLNTLLQKGKETRSNAIIIYKDGKLYNSTYFDTVKASTRIETMSCTKSIVALAVACLQADGLIDSLNVPVYKFYPEWKQGQKQLITLNHLLTMTSGIQNNPNATVEIYPSPDFVQLALAAELSSKPGEKWEYNNKALNLLAGIVKKVSGKRMDVYINNRLFKPLGIKNYGWTLDNAGVPVKAC